VVTDSRLMDGMECVEYAELLMSRCQTRERGGCISLRRKPRSVQVILHYASRLLRKSVEDSRDLLADDVI